MRIAIAIFCWFVITLLGIGAIVLLELLWPRIGRSRPGGHGDHHPSCAVAALE